MKYVCDVCGWEYDEEKGYPEGGRHNFHRSSALHGNNRGTGREYRICSRNHASYRQAISCLPIRRPLGMPVCSPDAGCHTPVLPSRPDEDRLSLRRDHEFRGSAVRARKTALRGYFSPDSADRKSRAPAAQPS